MINSTKWKVEQEIQKRKEGLCRKGEAEKLKTVHEMEKNLMQFNNVKSNVKEYGLQ